LSTFIKAASASCELRAGRKADVGSLATKAGLAVAVAVIVAVAIASVGAVFVALAAEVAGVLHCGAGSPTSRTGWRALWRLVLLLAIDFCLDNLGDVPRRLARVLVIVVSLARVRRSLDSPAGSNSGALVLVSRGDGRCDGKRRTSTSSLSSSGRSQVVTLVMEL
jgi:hypothetical protein